MAIKSRHVVRKLRKRNYLNVVFERCCGLSLAVSILFLALLLTSIVIKGYKAFLRTEILISLTTAELKANKEYDEVIRKAFASSFQGSSLEEISKIKLLISDAAEFELREFLKGKPHAEIFSIWLPASSKLDGCVKYKEQCDNLTLSITNTLQERNALRTSFNQKFFTNSDSREPEQAGMAASIFGSLLTIFICMLISCPLAIFSAVYLEEFAPKNKLTSFIEININNLASVPSIVFGLIGLAIFINMWEIPRSSPLVAGMTLSLMVLPSIIIVARQSIRSVPLSIKEGVMALGASELQILFHYTLPIALPGIITGVILAVCRAIGETAPLIMIGMVAFIADTPQGFLDPTTVMPVQIYLWADSPEIAFQEKTAAAIIVLLVILLAMNLLSVLLRKKYEIKW
jgi:phosphate transport system permease protein